MKPPRGLSDGEAAAWAKLADSVSPLPGNVKPKLRKIPPPIARKVAPAAPATKKIAPIKPHTAAATTAPRQGDTLDSNWERRIRSGAMQPDLTLDLHGLGLDAAYDRLLGGVSQARAMDARVVLVIAGKERPVDPADRGSKRGAIRAKMLDWLAASGHSSAIAAVRKAHRSHGGDGALYLVLRKGR